MKRNSTDSINSLVERNLTFNFFKDFSTKLRLTTISKDHKTDDSSYCSLRVRRRQLVTKQEDKRRSLVTTSPPPRLSSPTTRPSNEGKTGLLHVTPVVMYNTLRQKKQFFRHKNVTEQVKQTKRIRPKTVNNQYSNKSTIPFKILNLLKSSQGQKEVSSESTRRPCTAEIGSNRLRTLQPETLAQQFLLQEKLNGWDTNLDNDDF